MSLKVVLNKKLIGDDQVVLFFSVKHIYLLKLRKYLNFFMVTIHHKIQNLELFVTKATYEALLTHTNTFPDKIVECTREESVKSAEEGYGWPESVDAKETDPKVEMKLEKEEKSWSNNTDTLLMQLDACGGGFSDNE